MISEDNQICPRLLIGILAGSHQSKTLACLESLQASLYRDYEVFLIDNGSGEDIGIAAKRFPFVTVDILPRNVGVAAARNIVIRYFLNRGRWPYLLFLDNDVSVLPDTLGTIVRHAQELQAQGLRVGALGGHVVYHSEPQKYWCAGGALIDWENAWFLETGQGGLRGKDFCEPRRLDTIPTAFLLVTRDAVERVELFVEDYFMYFEDTDWSWRISKAGFELWSVPDAIAMHDVSSWLGECSPLFYYFRTRNRMWFFQAFSPKDSNKIRWRILKNVLWESAYPEFREGNIKAALAVILGFLAGIRVPRKLQMVAANSPLKN